VWFAVAWSQIKQVVHSNLPSKPWQHGSLDQHTFYQELKSLQEYLILCAFDDMLAGCWTPQVKLNRS
jgi:hypothetical protein